MILVGSMFWGMTGPITEWMLVHAGMTSSFMLAVRLIIAGTLILAFLKIRKEPVFAIWKEATWRRQLLIFSIVGMLGLQYSFVLTIQESNAVVATLLQFLAPIFIVIYLSILQKSLPPKSQVIGITGTLFGLFLLLTNGSMTSLLFSEKALYWGLIVGITYAFYTLYPVRLMNKWGVLTVVAWGMILSGVYSALIGRIWATDEWALLKDPTILWLMFALIVIGSAAFILFLNSMKYISAIETSVLSSFEPVTAMVISVIWLQMTLHIWQLTGIVLMLIFVAYLSIAGKK